jgi:hypothetical protein
MQPSCSTWSLQVGEPLAGSAAAQTELWIALEHAGPWGPKGADDSGLPAELAARLTRFTKEEKRARVQLIRKPERASAQERFLFLARGRPGASELLETRLARIEDLLAIDLDAWARGETPHGCAPRSEPLYLVCVHGRRDRCCAQRGMPVYSALATLAPDAVFQTTHLGGHRFAATLVVLPEGVCYGRLEAGEAEALMAAQRARRFHDLTRVRGRCAYGAEAQAAEVRLREDLGELALDALSLLAIERDAEQGVEVRFRHNESGVEHGVRVVKQTLEPSAQSCGATPKPSEGLLALSGLTRRS